MSLTGCSRTSLYRLTSQGILLSVSNSRNYATSLPGQQIPFKINNVKGGTTSKNKKAFSRKNRIGAFRSMNPSQLTEPILQPGPSLSLPSFKPELLTENMIGQVVAFDQIPNDPIKYFGTPKNMLLEFRLLSQRCSVIRNITVFTAEELNAAAAESSSKTRYVLTGPSGCGKSFLLLQAVQYCLAKDWIVIYIPRAKTTVNSTTTHTYDLRTQTYLQPNFAQQTLRRILEVNSANLQTLTMREGLNYERRSFSSGTTLAQLVSAGSKDTAISSVVLETLLNELSRQSKTPVLLAVDDFQALYNEKTTYRDPHFSAIRPYHLAIPRLILEFASGKRSFPKGAILGAVTAADPTFPVTNELMDELGLPGLHPRSPYSKRSKILLEYARGLKNLPVPTEFSPREAASVFETWMRDNALTAPANDELFLAKYTESAGNPKAFVWQGILGTLEGAPPVVNEKTPWPQLREGRI
ncbi:mitochondrial ribosomal death-associated protein 3-domain-containing protein [Lentinula raphanica]|uniref:Small ribosomal subunit protein mS29 n=1 Tax=Lentinula raphanica TaxID=153919 RepID=A0AA38ULS5_9AGAR|nr:mitochondrial ribosomal death-associated protein 3-domain-containing protein [Lentinula raphanica]KAJ3845386.1 mitochondrial ribosomal death-associated protein 3-domain-containing protein [Lentinula raphanica]KAJ3971873.1 mitochondrial ribosomal death-associated protein 3-domain-containing protein [Lentinula raphanica]